MEQWMILVLGLALIFLNIFMKSLVIGLAVIGCFAYLLFANPIPDVGAVALDYWKQFPLWFVIFGYAIYIGTEAEVV